MRSHTIWCGTGTSTTTHIVTVKRFFDRSSTCLKSNPSYSVDLRSLIKIQPSFSVFSIITNHAQLLCLFRDMTKKKSQCIRKPIRITGFTNILNIFYAEVIRCRKPKPSCLSIPFIKIARYFSWRIVRQPKYSLICSRVSNLEFLLSPERPSFVFRQRVCSANLPPSFFIL